MFGIAGIVSFDKGESPQALGEAALWMQRCLAPGPARRGLWQQGRAALVYAAPVEGAKQRQPVRVAVGGREWVMAYDGPENAQEALTGFIEWGGEWLGALGGAFALAVWQPLEEKLLLARDASGKKPLFCARTQGGLAFASDEAAILCLSDWTRIAGVEMLPAGCCAWIGSDLMALEPYA